MCDSICCVRILLKRSNGSVGEVVEDRVNGVIFDSADDLYQQLMVFSGLYYIDRRI